ncbi:MAG: PhoH family protein [Bacteroidales bacterium]|nr:PhoH family protein [Bacteroidales bacterium]
MANMKKIFVLDTSVILYNHNALQSFGDNDVAIPITVLEELDNFKKGNESKNFEAREFIRIMDALSDKETLQKWQKLDGPKRGKFKVVIDISVNGNLDAEKVFGVAKADHRILNVAIALQQEFPKRPVIMVTKDINLRIKAKAMGIAAEDFETGKIKNVDDLYTGKAVIENVSSEVIDRMYKEGYCDYSDLNIEKPVPHQYFILKSGRNSILAYNNPVENVIERIDKQPIHRIIPRNAEQVFAAHALLNSEVKLVTISGVAGTGKTLLALAAALEQRKQFKQVFLARPIIPLSNRDIGFLPGDALEKIRPYMEPLYDNLKFIKSQFGDRDKEFQNINAAVENEKLVISPLAYIRGRSLSNIFFIVDEAQNLTPHEVKTIITRAGEGTKIVFTGDIFQIDTPYLDSQSNGLSYLIHKIHAHDIYAHIRLEKGERSELANLANDLL